MPVLFVGHGSPLNAIELNRWSAAFRALAGLLPRPRAVLAWYVGGIFTTGNQRPTTSRDFAGFPEAVHAVQYPAPGDLALATRVVSLLGERRASVSLDWGLDHGTWSVLRHLLPAADVPVVQLSIDWRLAPVEHLALSQALAPLRAEGVLVMASGNATHNLRAAFTAAARGDRTVPEWAAAFDAEVARALERRDAATLTGVLETDQGRLAHPTPDHYLPLLYSFGASDTADRVRFPVTGFDMGSLSMRSVLFG
jgi:4,5-DOPA dioxygenase extradiol